MRTADEYATGTIPVAVNIEWREVLNRTDEIPTDRQVV
jgi:rhodanese-related sulfurtransferase